MKGFLVQLPWLSLDFFCFQCLGAKGSWGATALERSHLLCDLACKSRQVCQCLQNSPAVGRVAFFFKTSLLQIVYLLGEFSEEKRVDTPLSGLCSFWQRHCQVSLADADRPEGPFHERSQTCSPQPMFIAWSNKSTFAARLWWYPSSSTASSAFTWISGWNNRGALRRIVLEMFFLLLHSWGFRSVAGYTRSVISPWWERIVLQLLRSKS